MGVLELRLDSLKSLELTRHDETRGCDEHKESNEDILQHFHPLSAKKILRALFTRFYPL